jgi:hypothetical protein
MIKKYKDFIKESQTRYEHGCVMVDYNFENWSELLSSIKQEDIYKVEGKNYGLQPRPHLTLLYGISKDVSDDEIQRCFEESEEDDFEGMVEDDFKVQIEDISLF